MKKKKINSNIVWAIIGKITTFVLAQIGFAYLGLYIFENCITVYR